MKLKTLFTDDDAVSPVIGVILMVAITVILAAVIGAFVLNLGGGQNAAPQASFSFNNETAPDASNGGLLTVNHDGGDPIDNSTITINFGSNSYDPSGSSDWSTGKSVNVSAGAGGTGTGTSGTTFVTSNIDIEIVWNNPDGDDSRIIGEGSVN